MKTTYFLSNRKQKNRNQLIRQIQMFLERKKVTYNSGILIEITDAMKSETKFNTVKITIT
jgi:preprotein translocase subunit YajC